MKAEKLKKLVEHLAAVEDALTEESSLKSYNPLAKMFLVRNAQDMVRLAIQNLRRLEGYQREHQISSGVYTDRNNSMEER
jgi:alkylation response protein AidB-like acyl-CoA dehydrogenase